MDIIETIKKYEDKVPVQPVLLLDQEPLYPDPLEGLPQGFREQVVADEVRVVQQGGRAQAALAELARCVPELVQSSLLDASSLKAFVALLASDRPALTRRHAACALWASVSVPSNDAAERAPTSPSVRPIVRRRATFSMHTHQFMAATAGEIPVNRGRYEDSKNQHTDSFG